MHSPLNPTVWNTILSVGLGGHMLYCQGGDEKGHKVIRLTCIVHPLNIQSGLVCVVCPLNIQSRLA